MSLTVEELLASRRVMLLQGPMGTFFKQLSLWLTSHQVECFKVNFNAGDVVFFNGTQTYNYHGRLANFKKWLNIKLKELDIDAIVCFGDCRFYHAIALQLAREQGVKIFVFEEGYIRPDYITLERGGVNDFSQLREKFHALDGQELPSPDKPQSIDTRFGWMVFVAFTYYLFWILFFWAFPFYTHHRQISPLAEAFFWVRSFIRRVINYQIEPHRFLDIIKNHDRRYFIVALQVHNDSQVRVHSDYNDVEEFIVEVLESFADNAPPERHLVFKHHPMDRGYRHYGHLLRKHTAALGIADRVHYVCDVHFPTLIKHSIGLVAINSTSGLQSLFHEKPVKLTGRAIYSMPKLTYQGDLDQFWANPGRVNRLVYRRFRYALVHYSQLNGSYYGESPWMESYKQPDDVLSGHRVGAVQHKAKL